MTRSARAAALRSTALATSLALAVGLSRIAVEAGAKPSSAAKAAADRAQRRAQDDDDGRYDARHRQCNADCAANGGRPVIPRRRYWRPPTRQHAAPAAAARKQVTPAAVAATSSTSQADKDALENVIELVRKQKPADATPGQAAISDPVARKLAEWLILRSDNNGASVERYRAFISANPSWPSQTFLRRRLEAALWDDHRDDATVWSWFENKSPISAKGKFALAKGDDRARRPRQCRAAGARGLAQRSDVGRHRERALDMFGALLTAGDHKARMDALLYGTEQEAGGMRAAKRLGSGHRGAGQGAHRGQQEGLQPKALLDAVPRELHSDPGYMFAKIQLLRREEKFAEAAQLMLSAPKDPGRLHNLDEWWIERRLLSRKMLDVGEHRTAYLIARDAALPARDIYKTEQEFTAGWIALRFLNDPAIAAQHFARIGVGSVNPTALARAGYWQGRAAEAAGRAQEARAAYTRAAEQSTSYYGQLARAKLGLPQIELNGVPGGRGRGIERLEIVRAVQLLYELDEREIAIPVFADMGENGDPEALVGPRRTTSRYSDARGMLLMGKAALNRGLPFDYLRLSRQRHSVVQADRPGGRAEHRLLHRPAGKRLQSGRGFARAGLRADAGDAGCGALRLQAAGASFDLSRLKNDPVYNATLGAAELGGLIEDYRGSYIMTFAGLQCRPRQRQEMDRALRRPARSQGRRGRLGRADPVLRDPQLRAADHGEPAGLPRAVRRRHPAADRGRPAPRRQRPIARIRRARAQRLGCDGSFGFERCGVGADGTAHHRLSRSKGINRAR